MHAKHPAEGVQFRPETALKEGGQELPRNFLAGAR
jgi:anthranilate/para-aminobenzoate synthase component II